MSEEHPAAAGGRDMLEVHLVTPEREVWAGDAKFVSARTIEGSLGILPHHEPLAAILEVGPLFVDPADGARIAAAIDGGFLHVTTEDGATRVDILAEHALLADEVNEEELQALDEEAAALHREERHDEARTSQAKVRARQTITGDGGRA